MVSRLWPLNMRVAFEDGAFELGKAVDVTVELTANRDAEGREARIDLVCEEHYTENVTVMVPIDNRISRAGRDVGNILSLRARVPKRVREEHVDTYVHSCVVFLEDAQLQSGVSKTYKARLDIQPVPPEKTHDLVLKWKLVARADVVHARDVIMKFPVEVVVS